MTLTDLYHSGTHIVVDFVPLLTSLNSTLTISSYRECLDLNDELLVVGLKTYVIFGNFPSLLENSIPQEMVG